MPYFLLDWGTSSVLPKTIALSSCQNKTQWCILPEGRQKCQPFPVQPQSTLTKWVSGLRASKSSLAERGGYFSAWSFDVSIYIVLCVFGSLGPLSFSHFSWCLFIRPSSDTLCLHEFHPTLLKPSHKNKWMIWIVKSISFRGNFLRRENISWHSGEFNSMERYYRGVGWPQTQFKKILPNVFTVY